METTTRSKAADANAFLNAALWLVKHLADISGPTRYRFQAYVCF